MNLPKDAETEDDTVQTADGRQNNAYIRAGINAVGGAIPFVGGILSAGAGIWSEKEQERINKFIHQMIGMLKEELREKERTITEIVERIDMMDETIKTRIESTDYQALLKKVFRNWAAIDTESKRIKVRNILSNAAVTRVSSDDVIRLFIDWLTNYSDFHFEVIGEIYQNEGVSRAEIWGNLGRGHVREDSADADLFKLLIRDLSTGGVIRQHRETDLHGRPYKKQSSAKPFAKSQNPYLTSAFDDKEQYVLTELGKQFVHYAMNEIVSRIGYDSNSTDVPRSEHADV